MARKKGFKTTLAKRTYAMGRNAIQRAAQRDLARYIHPPVDLKRKEECRYDLVKFLNTYFPQVFSIPFSVDHITILKNIEECCLKGGLFCLAAPRSTGKSTMLECACIWSVLYGHRRFVVPISASVSAAQILMENIRTHFETNELLEQDFSEMCQPIIKLEGVSSRGKTQTVNGIPTGISWNKGKLIMPTVMDANGKEVEGSGACIHPKGIGGSLRGMGLQTKTGEKIRPDIVFCDDLSTEESASSEIQVKQLETLVQGAILGLAGVGKKIACVHCCTVIKKNDLADKMLDPEKYPEWQGRRFSLLYNRPENKELWETYFLIRKKNLINGDRTFKDATEFYKKNQVEMDKGAVVAWEHRKNIDEISALQHCMNLIMDRGEIVFASEYQNKPINQQHTVFEVKPKDVYSRVNNYKRLEIPPNALYTVAATDINYSGLHWTIASIDKNDCVSVIAYGKTPANGNLVEQNDNEPTRNSKIAKGLTELEGILKGYKIPIVKFCIDAGFAPEIVRRWIESRRNPAYVCSRGFAANKYRQSKDDLQQWMQCHLTETKTVGKHIVLNADYYREKMLKAFLGEEISNGSCTLFNAPKEIHADYADQITSEQLIDKAEGNNNVFYKWYKRIGSCNDWGDSLTYCHMLFATLGTGTGALNKCIQAKKSTVVKRKTTAKLDW